MADKKISQLTAASTPLAGTEVLPIVQSGSTVKVSAADVTAGRQVSAAGLTVTSSTVPANGMYLPATNTIGFSTNSIARARLNASGEFAIGNIATPRAELDVAHSDTSGSVTRSIHLGYSGANFYGYRVSNTNNAGATYAGTFAIQRGEGTQWTDNFTISDVGNVTVNTGNLVVGTAAKGIDFSANTGAAGETSSLLDWYEEGTYTVTLYDDNAGGNASATTVTGRYSRVGNVVHCKFAGLNSISTAGMTAGNTLYMSLPFTPTADGGGTGSFACENFAFGAGRTNAIPAALPSQSRAIFRAYGSGTSTRSLLVSDVTSGSANIDYFSLTYQV